MCAVLDLSGTLCSLLGEASLSALRNLGISFVSFSNEVISTLFLFMTHMVKMFFYNSLFHMDDLMFS